MRGDMVDRDYVSYFTLYRDSALHADARSWTEFGYFWLQDVFEGYGFSFPVFLGAIGLVAIGTKVFALYLNDRERVGIGLVVYFATYFMLHDMTQVRVSVSSGLFLLSLIALRDGREIRFILFNLAAIAFHSSGALGFIALALCYRPRRFEAFFFAIAPVVLTGLGLLSMLNWLTPLLAEMAPDGRVELYATLLREGQYSEINLVSVGFLILVTLNAVLWLRLHEGPREMKGRELLYLRIFSVGIMCYPLFSSLPVLAFRISEYFCIVVLFLVQRYYCLRRYPVLSVLILSYLISALYVNVVREGSLLGPYTMELREL